RHTRSKRDWSSDVCSSDLSWALQHQPMPHQIPPGINSPNASPVETGASTLVMVFRADYSSSSQPGNPMADQVAQRTLAVLNRFALLKMFSTTRAGAHGHLIHSRTPPTAKLTQANRQWTSSKNKPHTNSQSRRLLKSSTKPQLKSRLQ